MDSNNFKKFNKEIAEAYALSPMGIEIIATPLENDSGKSIDKQTIDLLNSFHKQWIDLPIPALDNKTPREASKTELGRRELESLFAYYKKGSSPVPFPFKAIRRELGLEEVPIDSCGGGTGIGRKAGVSTISFHDTVVKMIKKLPTTLPLDIVLTGAHVEQGVVLECSEVVEQVHNENANLGRYTVFETRNLGNGLFPLGWNNVFMEYSSESSRYVGQTPISKFGIHVVSLDTAKNVHFLQDIYSKYHKHLDTTHQNYMFITYLGKQEIEVYGFGMILGLDDKGKICLKIPFDFEGCTPEKGPNGVKWGDALNQLNGFMYVVNDVFGRINNDSIALNPNGVEKYVVKLL